MTHREEMIDLVTAAALIGRHPATLYRWIRAGKLPAYHVLGRTVIRREDLLELQKAQPLQAPQGQP